MLPFPSSAYLAPSESSSTGFRVDLAPAALPVSAATVTAVDVTRWNRHLGFSWATPILAYFPERIDVTSLPAEGDERPGLEPDSATVIVELPSGTRVPHFAEVDVSTDIGDDERQPLMLRPLTHLRPGTRYAVGITSALRSLDGGTPARPTGFARALSGGRATTLQERRVMAALPETLGALAAAGVEQRSLLLAWDFTTDTVESVTRPVLHMRDRALEDAAAAPARYTVDSVERDPFVDTSLMVRGTFEVTSFLDNDDRSRPAAALVLGADGLPLATGKTWYPYRAIVPRRVLTSGAVDRLLIYGHGLLEDNEAVDDDYVRELCEERGYVAIGTDWIGLSSTEATGIGASAAAVDAVKDLNRLGWVTDRYQQAQVNFMVLVRAARSILDDAALALPDGSSPLAAQATPVYFGISQGGIMGPSLLAYSPDLQHAVAQVGGSAYSLMIQRSTHWTEFWPALRNAYPDRVDQQLVMALWQPEFDRSEGSGTAWSSGAHEPLPGTTRKSLLIQLAVGDCQVPNLATWIQARTLGLPLLGPSPVPAWGLEETTSEASQGLSVWSFGRALPPDTNATPSEDNGVHGDLRYLPQNQEQTDLFLRTGVARNTCAGPCSFEGWAP